MTDLPNNRRRVMRPFIRSHAAPKSNRDNPNKYWESLLNQALDYIKTHGIEENPRAKFLVDHAAGGSPPELLLRRLSIKDPSDFSALHPALPL